MSGGTGWVLTGAVAFLGSHLALSHPLRRPLIIVLGEKTFSALYSVIAVVTLGATIIAYRAAPSTEPLFGVSSPTWMVATFVMLVASVLLVGSMNKNPALPGGGTSAATAEARGVYGITRHPMMWSFALWGLCHIAVYPVTKNIILSGVIVVLALVGAVFQDGKKRQLDPQGWKSWQARTSYIPFLAIAQRRAAFGGFGILPLAGGLVLWAVATWAHTPLGGAPSGIWRWVGR